jgi:hypothetical protein
MNMVGGEQTLEPDGGDVKVKIDSEPVYIIAGKSSDVTAVSEAPRTNAVVADSITGFSGKQGENGWTYGWCTSNKDGSAPYQPDHIQMMKWLPSVGDWFDSWAGPGEWFKITESGCQPSAANGAQCWAIRRWTSAIAGPVHIVGNVERSDPHGDGVGCKIFLDGQEVFSKLIKPEGHEAIDLNITLKEGSKLDFAVTPGPGTDSSYDSTGFHASILKELRSE